MEIAFFPQKVITKANFILNHLETSNKFNDEINIELIRPKAA